jgi:hypothetical protein
MFGPMWIFSPGFLVNTSMVVILREKSTSEQVSLRLFFVVHLRLAGFADGVHTARAPVKIAQYKQEFAAGRTNWLSRYRWLVSLDRSVSDFHRCFVHLERNAEPASNLYVH